MFERDVGVQAEYRTIDMLFLRLFSDSNVANITDTPEQVSVPPAIREFLDGLGDMSDVEKMHEVHNFLIDNFEYKKVENDKVRPNHEYLQELKGDCDDFSNAQSHMLRLLGFKDVAFLAAGVRYVGETHELPASHAITLTKVDGQLYALDVNVKEPMALDGATIKNVQTVHNEIVDLQIEQPWALLEFGAGKAFFVWPEFEDEEGSFSLVYDGKTQPKGADEVGAHTSSQSADKVGDISAESIINPVRSL